MPDTVRAAECPAQELVGRLRDVLTHGNYCFRSGAFVVEDPDGKIFERLRKSCRAYPRIGGRTHDEFKNPKKFARRYAQGEVLSRLDPDLVGAAQYEIYTRARFKWCTPDISVPPPALTTLLFYPFAVIAARPRASTRMRYLYLKLETFPFWHPWHAVSAFNHYVLRHKKKLADCEDNRTENPSRAATRPRCGRSWASNNARVMQTRSSQHTFYERYVRMGGEFFVPQAALQRA